MTFAVRDRMENTALAGKYTKLATKFSFNSLKLSSCRFRVRFYSVEGVLATDKCQSLNPSLGRPQRCKILRNDKKTTKVSLKENFTANFVHLTATALFFHTISNNGGHKYP